MHRMQLSAFDANLFVVFHAVLREGHVGRAAKRLGLSPSATSHALARLRELLRDPLFVRAGRRIVPTSRATELAPSVEAAMAALESAMTPPADLDARTLLRAFHVETTDHLQFVLMRHLDPLVRREAPGVNVYFQSLQPQTFDRLRGGAIDLSIGVYDEVDPDIERARLFDDRLVAVVRRRHPALRSPMTMEKFARLDHLLVAPNGTPTGLVDRVLAERGLQRRVARTSSTFLDMAFLVAESSYVLSLPEKMIQPMLGVLGLVVLPVPIAMPRFTISMAWHKRHSADGAHAWFRRAVQSAAVKTGGRARVRTARPAEKSRRGDPLRRPSRDRSMA
jgi:DNA-binding transcriptional LysR family regulator